MTSSTQPRTTIGQLVYRSMPPLDFERLVVDLDAALVGADAGRLRLVEDGGDLALLDLGAARVGVALVRGLDAKGAMAVIVTVGYGPNPRGDASLARRQSVLARLIADRITARFVPLETLWSTSEEVATPATFARLREELVARRRAQNEAQAERARARRARPMTGLEPGDVARMFGRLESALAARRSGRAEPVGRSSSEDGEPSARAADEPETKSAPIRLAAHLIDATLMIVALPVGVAMMIYGLSRGADLHNSARALAISGTGIGLLQTAGGVAGLQALLLRAI
jgi:hypothetical protein